MSPSDLDHDRHPTGAVPRPERPLLACYANYFEVGHNAFEFLLDAGQVEPQSGDVQLMSRIAVSPVHAKLLATLLNQSIAQFEHAHHDIPDIAELDGDLSIINPQEFERRAIDARRKRTAPGGAAHSHRDER
ncbi:DUF3467 domain-containing protein [Sphingomonas asaccharolytica]|uniref:DUF3467 domain-containing protein n=1 Tax=Sphingomonas asaccharolytica TaxID=40681 RepID=UPI0008309E7C|nr:DUF3467 domain-containing protein [Sphingomonas asaccharolytica]